MPQESQWREKEKNQNYTHSRTNNTSRLRKRIKKRVHNMQPTGDKNNHDRTFSDVTGCTTRTVTKENDVFPQLKMLF